MPLHDAEKCETVFGRMSCLNILKSTAMTSVNRTKIIAIAAAGL